MNFNSCYEVHIYRVNCQTKMLAVHTSRSQKKINFDELARKTVKRDVFAITRLLDFFAHPFILLCTYFMFNIAFFTLNNPCTKTGCDDGTDHPQVYKMCRSPHV